jgi:hypothetical protein
MLLPKERDGARRYRRWRNFIAVRPDAVRDQLAARRRNWDKATMLFA